MREVHFIKPSHNTKLSMLTKLSAARGFQQTKKDAIISLLRAVPNGAGLKLWTELLINNNSEVLLGSLPK